MKKIGLFISILVFMVGIGIYIANNILSKHLSEIINKELREKISTLDVPLFITYSQLEVSVISSSVTIEDVSLTDDNKLFLFNCERMKIDVSIPDAIKIAKSRNVELLRSANIIFYNLSIIEFQSNSELTIGNISVGYNGYLSKRIIEELTYIFPVVSQTLQISISDMKLDLPELYRELLLTYEFREKLSTVDRFSLGIGYSRDPNKITIEEFEISTPLVNLNYNGTIDYFGDNPNNFIPDKLHQFLSVSSSSKLDWGNKNESGRYSLSKFIINVSSNVSFDENRVIEEKFIEGKIKLLLEGVLVELPDELVRQFKRTDFGMMVGNTVDRINLEKLLFDIEYDNDILLINEALLKTPQFNIYMSGDLLVDKYDPLNSIVNKSKITIQDLSPELELIVARIERDLRQSLPRDENKIVLEIGGKINNPKIKGLNLNTFE